jgi:hypothetical protein
MNANTVNRIVNLARQSYNARHNQGQQRITQINQNLRNIEFNHGRNAVNRVFKVAYKSIKRENERKRNRAKTLVRNAAHRFKVGPRVAMFRKTKFHKKLPLNMQLKVLGHVLNYRKS